MVLYRVSVLSRVAPPPQTEPASICAEIMSTYLAKKSPTASFCALEHLARLPDGVCALDTDRYLETGVLDDADTRLYVFEDPVKAGIRGAVRQWDIVYGFVCATMAPKLRIDGKDVPLTLEDGVYRIGKGGLICLALRHAAEVECADPYTILGIQLPNTERLAIARSTFDINKFTC